MKIRKYHPDAETQDDGAWHIAENPTGFDGTLCGLADEGLGNVVSEPVEKLATLRRVTCVQCLAIVEFCKSLK